MRPVSRFRHTRCFFLPLFVIVFTMTSLFLVSCSSGKYRDGTYGGEATGNNGTVKVSVTVSSGKIKEVKVTDHKETPALSDPAIERVPANIVKKQTWDVDAVSGATNTSKAIKAAAKAALDQAAK